MVAVLKGRRLESRPAGKNARPTRANIWQKRRRKGVFCEPSFAKTVVLRNEAMAGQVKYSIFKERNRFESVRREGRDPRVRTEDAG